MLREQNFNSYSYIEEINQVFRCLSCSSPNTNYNSSHHSLECSDCNQQYPIKNGVVDALTNPSPPTRNELLGMALENGFTEENFNDFKVKILSHVPCYEEILKSTEGQHSNYYLQTKMNYDQVCSHLPTISNGKILEIGASSQFQYLKPFSGNGNSCFALNLHYTLQEGSEESSWPNKVIADMNTLPFQDNSFDLIIISATSHHSTTPETLVKEIFRALRPGGNCLMINDPTWGILKNLGGPDNTEAWRESHINENEYSIWRYNRMFRQAGFQIQHFFSAYYDQLLREKPIHPKTRFAFFAKLIKKAWKNSLFQNFFRGPGLWLAQAIFGFPMNVILTKPK